MIKYTSHPHGLASVNIIFEGSNMEQAGEFGCAHMLEHLVCKRLAHLEADFANEGIEFNARTCPETTHYYIRGLDKSVKKYAKEFIRLITEEGLKFTPQELEIEKEIIQQEWQDADMEAERNLFNRFFEKYYKTPRTLGNLQEIKNISFQKIKAMAERSYKNPIMCVIEQGSKWKVDNQIDLAKNHDSLWDYNVCHRKSFTNKNTDQNQHLMLISDSFSGDFTKHYAIMSMLGDGFISPLMTTLREEKQLIYGLDGNLEWFNPQVAHTRFMMSTDRKNESLLWQEFCKILQNKQWFTKERFQQIKNKNLIELEIMYKRGELTKLDELLYPWEFIMHEEMKKMKFSDLAETIKFYIPKNFILFK